MKNCMNNRANRRTSKLLPFLAAGLLSVLATDPSFATINILNTVPMSGATVLTAPHTITLEFTGDIVPGSPNLSVSDAAGKPVAIGPVAPGTAKNSITVPITAPLPGGTFEVTWRVTAPDNTASSGSFSFTYKP